MNKQFCDLCRFNVEAPCASLYEAETNCTFYLQSPTKQATDKLLHRYECKFCLDGFLTLDHLLRSEERWKCPVCNSENKEQATVETVLAERGNRYGSFADNSRISQTLKKFFDQEERNRLSRNQAALSAHHREALDMMATKICRIFSGDPSYEDNWIDIAGYAELGRDPR